MVTFKRRDGRSETPFPVWTWDNETARDVRAEHASWLYNSTRDRSPVASDRVSMRVRKATPAEVRYAEHQHAADVDAEARDLSYAESGGGSEMARDLWASRTQGNRVQGKGRRAKSSEEILRSSFATGRGGTKIFLTYDHATGQYVVRSRFQDHYRSRKGLKPNSAKARAALKRAEDRFETTLLFTPGGTDWKDHGRRAESKRDFVKRAWERQAPTMSDIELPSPIPGMEGPFRYRSGKILYWDPKEGEYYDRGRDMYVEVEDAEVAMSGRRAKSHSRRVGKCISGKVKGEGWDQRRAVAACLNMDREGRLRADGSYIRKGGRRAGGYEVDDFGSPLQWKTAWDDDFRAGFAAGTKAVDAAASSWVKDYRDRGGRHRLDLAAGRIPRRERVLDATSAYKRGKISKRHGSEWVMGYSAALDVKQGAYATKGARRAQELGLGR